MKADKQEGQQRIKESIILEVKIKRECGNLICQELDLNLNCGVEGFPPHTTDLENVTKSTADIVYLE